MWLRRARDVAVGALEPTVRRAPRWRPCDPSHDVEKRLLHLMADLGIVAAAEWLERSDGVMRDVSPSRLEERHPPLHLERSRP